MAYTDSQLQALEAALAKGERRVTDGSQVAAGVLMQDADAHLAERLDGLMVARHAIVADHALRWPVGMAVAEQRAAILQLKALGVLVRTGA